MSDTSSRSRTDRTAEDPSPRNLEVIDDGTAGVPEQYTFVPQDADGETLLTTWMTVDRETIADLEEWR